MSVQSSPGTVFDVLADYRRRFVLSCLLDRDGPLSLRDLATATVAWEENVADGAVTEGDRAAMAVGLHHNHLPRLDEAGYVTYDTESSTVTLADHTALEEDWVIDLVANPFRPADSDRDAVLDALTAPRRRVVLAVLGERGDTISMSDLATTVAAREREVPLIEVSDREHADVAASLHHVHLPGLAAAGLLEYDTFALTVSPLDAPWLRADWLADSPVEYLAGAFERTREARAESVRTIEGRENIIARGQELFEDADEELFIMVTTDGLLEEGCLTRLRDAVDRGVDVYVGSQTADVRDLVRERVPDATIWEPQLDWVNLPPEREQLGRLVFADRAAIMLATLGERNPDGSVRETAITGEGQDNSIVVLVRELLGPRLDHLDLQSEDFLDHLPL